MIVLLLYTFLQQFSILYAKFFWAINKKTAYFYLKSHFFADNCAIIPIFLTSKTGKNEEIKKTNGKNAVRYIVKISPKSVWFCVVFYCA